MIFFLPVKYRLLVLSPRTLDSSIENPVDSIKEQRLSGEKCLCLGGFPQTLINLKPNLIISNSFIP